MLVCSLLSLLAKPSPKSCLLPLVSPSIKSSLLSSSKSSAWSLPSSNLLHHGESLPFPSPMKKKSSSSALLPQSTVQLPGSFFCGSNQMFGSAFAFPQLGSTLVSCRSGSASYSIFLTPKVSTLVYQAHVSTSVIDVSGSTLALMTSKSSAVPQISSSSFSPVHPLSSLPCLRPGLSSPGIHLGHAPLAQPCPFRPSGLSWVYVSSTLPWSPLVTSPPGSSLHQLHCGPSSCLSSWSSSGSSHLCSGSSHLHHLPGSFNCHHLLGVSLCLLFVLLQSPISPSVLPLSF